MLSTGIIRKIDHVSRIIIPKELIMSFEITSKDSFELFTDGDTIILKKFESGDTFCGHFSSLETYKGKQICRDCIETINETSLPAWPEK